MKNYSFFKYYVGGAAAHVGYVLHTISSWVTEHISSAYHHVRGSWYCHYFGKAFQQHCEPASSDTVPRHVYDPHNPSPDWEPKIWFRCDPLKNDSCKNMQCRLNMMFSPEESACERTSKPEYSVDGKVLWPDKEFFEGAKRTRDTTSHACRHCPMDPADCKTYEKRPCDTTETYSDFIEQEVNNERAESNQP